MATIHRRILTKNNCYKTGKKQKIRGGILHSTGADNPFLSRYIGTDPLLGVNKYNNGWNQPKPDGRSVCVNAFIGYIKDKKDIATVQTLDWNHVAWHSGYGKKGSANTMGYFGVEMCEDGLSDRSYFNKVYKEAVEVFAEVFTDEKLPVNRTTIMDHSEAHKAGIASNHGDVMHWFRKHGKTMDNFRNDVKKLMAGASTSAPTTPGGVTFYNKSKNNKGLGVVRLQEDLEKLGYSVGRHGTNGIFGNDTESAVKKFQRDNGLLVDGSAGPATLNKIKQVLGSNSFQLTYKRPLKQGSNGGDVKELQKALVKLGYNPRGIDGNFGPGCNRSVREFQGKNGLSVDGSVGPATVRKINELLRR